MAERLGAKFTIDITDLKTGIRTANDLIKQNEAAFQADVAEMGNWQKSEEGLRKRLDLLASKFDIQKKKVNDLIKERQRLIDEAKKQNKTDEEIAQITSQVNTMLDRETKALDSVRRETEKTEKSLDDLGKENDEAGKSAENAANGGFTVMKGALANLAAEGIKAAVNGLKKLGKAIIEAGARADDLNTLAKQSGFTTAELQKFDYAADLIDVSTADIVSSARKLKKNLTSTSSDVTEAFDQIGVSVRDSSGELRSANDVFYEVVEGLSKIENETERDTLAMTLFGKGADDLAGIIDDGGAALAEYGKEAEDLGIILDQKTLDKANEFNDSIDRIKATGKGLFAEIGAELAGELSPEIDGLRGKIQNFVKSGELKKYVKVAVDALKSFAKIALEVGKSIIPIAAKSLKFLAENFTKIAPVIGTVVGGLAAFKAALAIKSAITAFTSPVGAAVAAVSLLTVGITAFAKEAENTPTARLAAEMKELKTKAEDAASAFDDVQKASDKMADSNISAITPTQNLWTELQKIVDANGKIKEGYEDRAKYIAEKLGTDTGIAINIVDGEVQKYGELKKAINDVIAQKKYEALASAYQSQYLSAYEGVGEAESEWANNLEALRKAQSERESFLTEYAEYFRDVANGDGTFRKVVRTDIEGFASVRADFEKINEAILAANSAVETSRATLNEQRETIRLYEEAEMAALSGDTKTAEKILKNFNTTVEKAGADYQKLAGLLYDEANDADNKLRALNKELIDGGKNIDSAYRTYLENSIKETKAYFESTKRELQELGTTYEELWTRFNNEDYFSTFPVPKIGPVSTPGSVTNSVPNSNVVINQTNNYSAAHSRYEIYQSKADTLAALRLAQSEGY